MSRLQEVINEAKKFEAEIDKGKPDDTGTDTVKVLDDAEDIIKEVSEKGFPNPSDMSGAGKDAKDLAGKIRAWKRRVASLKAQRKSE